MGAVPNELMTTPQPIKTTRLVLRPFTEADAAALVPAAGAFEIADMTLTIPHPYSIEDARKWIGTMPEGFEKGRSFPMAITIGSGQGELVGAIGLEVSLPHARAELGYWIAVPHWGKGYATEAGWAMLMFAFETLNLQRVTAHHFARNPASGRILQKIGMKHEGMLRQHIKKWDHFEDCVMYGVLRDEFSGLAGKR
jgi:ribosomal-protein-alanine N-acetyltransferase